jgi:hypothetical protein
MVYHSNNMFPVALFFLGLYSATSLVHGAPNATVIEAIETFVASLDISRSSAEDVTTFLQNDEAVVKFLSGTERIKRATGRVDAACHTFKLVLGDSAILNPEAIRTEVEESWQVFACCLSVYDCELTRHIGAKQRGWNLHVSLARVLLGMFPNPSRS